MTGSPQSDEGEDDYMSMTFTADTVESETSLQRRARKQREGETKSLVKSKKELEAEATRRREAALAVSLDETNLGFRMMKKLGYQPGATLGKADDARSEPIKVEMKEDRSGVGLDSVKKRKFREHWEAEAKRVKVDEQDYRERMRQEREDKRLSKLVSAAQKICERLDTEKETTESPSSKGVEPIRSSRQRGILQSICHNQPIKSINVLWRGLVRTRLDEEIKKRADAEIIERKHLLADASSDDEGQADKAAGPNPNALFDDGVIFNELEEDDPELQAFADLDPAEQLAKLLEYLRTVHQYCLWCKHQYADASMEDCPGVDEEAHD